MPASLGQQLQQARQARGLSIEEAARVTYIRPQYLRALESDDASSLPSVVQGRGFLRNYAAYLGLDFATLTGALVPAAEVPEPAAETVARQAEAVLSEPDVEPALVAAAGIPQAEAPSIKSRSPKPAPARKPMVAAPPAPRQNATPTPNADGIFKEIGRQLQEQRERLSLSLEDIEEHTHIRSYYLKALEEGDFEMLPSFTQARGMLSHYASFLSLNHDAVLNRFAEALLARRQEINEEQAHPGPGQANRQAGRFHRFLTMDALAGSLGVILMLILVVWGASRVLDRSASAGIQATPPSVAEVLLSSPESASTLEATATIPGGSTLLPTEAAPLETLVPTGAGLPPLEPGKVQVFIAALGRAWMRVDVDGKTVFTGRVEPGGAYPYSGDQRIELTTSNGGALQVYLNQQDLGTAGAWNEIIHLVYTDEGALLPTTTVTATPTRTLRPSPTVPATRTPVPGSG